MKYENEKPIWLMCLLALTIAACCQIQSAHCRSFALVEASDLNILTGRGWDLSQPIWKPDSTLAMVDKPGNVDFTADELTTLDSLGATMVDADTVKVWLIAEGWLILEEE